MCPICWINGLIALLISVGILSIDSPFTPYLIGIAVILTAYSIWKFWKGYKKWQNFSPEQRAKNWKTIKRFTQGVLVGAIVATVVFYSLNYNHHEPGHMMNDSSHIHESTIQG